ncbi:MAG: twin-arginine translocase TatA/TatE family subunit [Bacteroidales bacterium]|nr:twin-arginine translocase TatA/TatE family subunit [Bacteroidales bacterium]
MNISFLFIGTTEIVVILAVVLLLFGGKKIPELMNGLGKGVKSFKDGMNGKDEPSANATQAKDEAPASDKKQE